MPEHQITVDNETYVLTFNDEFDGAWDKYYDGHGQGGVWNTSFSPHLEDTRFLPGNGEGQYYVDPDQSYLPNPFTTGDGAMTIHTTPLTEAEQALAGGQGYSSGLLTTELSFGVQGGYIEIRADVPDQQGMLSAFWLLPEDGDWSDEIDVFEIKGSNTDVLLTNVWEDGTPSQQITPLSGLGDGFHTYGLHWTDTTLTWYVDGVAVRTSPNTVDENMYLAVSLAVDTTWTGQPDGTTDFSDGLSIDYIRVYENAASPTRNDAIPEGGEFVPDPYGSNDVSETLYGTRWDDAIDALGGDDVAYGRQGRDVLNGGDGADELHGNRHDDILIGGGGNDKLIGGMGNDVLHGGAGTDHMWGGNFNNGSGSDTFQFESGMGKDFIHDFKVKDDIIDVSAFDTNWAELSQHLEDQGWATYLNMGNITGVWTDMLYLAGITASSLTAQDFDFG